MFKKRKRRDRFFFLDGRLHKILRIVHGKDLVECWSFEDDRAVAYPWSMVKKRMGRAYRTSEVAAIFNRHRIVVENYLLDGKVRKPPKSKSLTTGRPGHYMWSDAHVLELHDYLKSIHFGRPRNDGKNTPFKIPSRRELLALLRNDTITYVKTKDGEFVPVWVEPEW